MMDSVEASVAGSRSSGEPDEVDVLVVGAGIVGLYQLYRAVEEGFSVRLLEAGGEVGGVWFWNRYPEARFDSESYSYAYLLSKELFDEWVWSEHFAGQPEVERYLNHFVDRFDLRRHITCHARVYSAVWDAAGRRWTVAAADGTVVRAQFVVSTTGNLSIPVFPEVPGREDFQGVAHHTGLWPKEPVDFIAQRVAVVGTGASGVQLVPAVADQVESLVVYQRTANWCVPLNNRPITDEEQAELRANFEQIRNRLLNSLSGFIHEPHDRKTFEDTDEQRRLFYEKMWNAPGFATLTSNYTDLLSDEAANAEFCEFLREKIRGIVTDPVTAEKLIPKDHHYGGKRPPFVTRYYEAFNHPNVSLVDLHETPMLRVTETGIETADGHREFDIIAWATGFDFGTGALLRMGIRGRDGRSLNEHWVDGPLTFLGIQSSGFPNLFFPAGPHGAGGNNPRVGANQVEYAMKCMLYVRDHGFRVLEVPAANEEAWTNMVNTLAANTPFVESSYLYGGNVPGKAKRLLVNPGGKPKFMEMMQEVVDNDFKGFLS
jgi:cation diffusion facilitator CzcD-associated flavoprotein CzcO